MPPPATQESRFVKTLNLHGPVRLRKSHLLANNQCCPVPAEGTLMDCRSNVRPERRHYSESYPSET